MKVDLCTFKKRANPADEDVGRDHAFNIPMDYIRSNGFVEDGKITIKCHLQEYIVPGKVKWNYNSKLETGMVGLHNLGATCYLNALLQVKNFLLI